jgi:hypothetical protein
LSTDGPLDDGGTDSYEGIGWPSPGAPGGGIEDPPSIPAIFRANSSRLAMAASRLGWVAETETEAPGVGGPKDDE